MELAFSRFVVSVPERERGTLRVLLPIASFGTRCCNYAQVFTVQQTLAGATRTSAVAMTCEALGAQLERLEVCVRQQALLTQLPFRVVFGATHDKNNNKIR